jgi:hypothetical protein
LKRSTLAALSLLSLPILAAAALPASAASHASSPAKILSNSTGTIDEPLCQSNKSTCADTGLNYSGQYVGHDEPSLEFRSGIPGSGNDMTYVMTLPREPGAPRGTSSCGRHSGSG